MPFTSGFEPTGFQVAGPFLPAKRPCLPAGPGALVARPGWCQQQDTLFTPAKNESQALNGRTRKINRIPRDRPRSFAPLVTRSAKMGSLLSGCVTLPSSSVNGRGSIGSPDQRTDIAATIPQVRLSFLGH